MSISSRGDVKVIEGQPDTDPRPLYFIPFDPTVGHDEYGRKTLEQRLLSEVLSLVGRAKVPSKTLLTSEDLLQKATWGMYNLWDSRDAKTNLRRQVNVFLRNKIASSFPQNFNQEQDVWILTIESSNDKENILSAFQKIGKIGEITEAQLPLI